MGTVSFGGPIVPERYFQKNDLFLFLLVDHSSNLAFYIKS
jgi:hypothetical protein